MTWFKFWTDDTIRWPRIVWWAIALGFSLCAWAFLLAVLLRLL
jgi:hypothetical protein